MQNATTCATPAASAVDRLWRAGCSDKLHAQFGEGWLEKEHVRATSLASYSTVRTVLRRGTYREVLTYATALRSLTATADNAGRAKEAGTGTGQTPTSRHRA